MKKSWGFSAGEICLTTWLHYSFQTFEETESQLGMGRRSPEVKAYIDSLRLGQTEVGSHIVNVIAPVGPSQSNQGSSMGRILKLTDYII
jgi:uncharacterized protein YwlG (UPF0340 family)